MNLVITLKKEKKKHCSISGNDPLADPIYKLWLLLTVCEGRREPELSEGGKQRFSVFFLLTCALILSLPNTIGGGLPPPSKAATGRRTFTEKQIPASEMDDRQRQRGSWSFAFITNHQTLIKTMCIHKMFIVYSHSQLNALLYTHAHPPTHTQIHT